MTEPAPDAAALTEQAAADALVRVNAVLNSYGIRGQLWHDLNAIVAPALATTAAATPPTGVEYLTDAQPMTPEGRDMYRRVGITTTPPTASHDETALSEVLRRIEDRMTWPTTKAGGAVGGLAIAARIVTEVLREQPAAHVGVYCTNCEAEDLGCTACGAHGTLLAARAAAAPDTGAGDEGLRARIKPILADMERDARQGPRSAADGIGAGMQQQAREVARRLRAALAADTTNPDGAS